MIGDPCDLCGECPECGQEVGRLLPPNSLGGRELVPHTKGCSLGDRLPPCKHLAIHERMQLSGEKVYLCEKHFRQESR